MNWKTLGEAILVMVGLLAFTALIALIIHVFPLWISLAIAFSAGVAVFYHMMEKEDNYSDNDRMNWFSNDDEEEEDETQ